jgi:hypothetical protein
LQRKGCEDRVKRRLTNRGKEHGYEIKLSHIGGSPERKCITGALYEGAPKFGSYLSRKITFLPRIF